MRFFRNKNGKIFMTSIGGTYPVNDGNPENDVDENEIPDEPDFCEEMEDAMERRIDRDNERY